MKKHKYLYFTYNPESSYNDVLCSFVNTNDDNILSKVSFTIKPNYIYNF